MSSNNSYDEDREKEPVDVFVHEKDLERSPDAVYVNRYKRFGPWMSKLFASGVEARGVERVPEDQRDSKNMWNKYVRTFHVFPLGRVLMFACVNLAS